MEYQTKQPFTRPYSEVKKMKRITWFMLLDINTRRYSLLNNRFYAYYLVGSVLDSTRASLGHLKATRPAGLFLPENVQN